FNFDVSGIDERSLNFVCRDPTNVYRTSDELLLWHFRQSAIANMRGEHDFPAGTD
ncbi:hypothetical protein EV426DRAFT_512536, partial [Tirmania nivea]